jgi:hypothetical protein
MSPGEAYNSRREAHHAAGMSNDGRRPRRVISANATPVSSAIDPHDSTMLDRSDATRRSRRAWTARARTFAAIGASSALALVATACGGGQTPSGIASVASGSTTTTTVPQTSTARYVACMRAHGVIDFPDPLPGGGFHLAGDTASRQFEAAARACQSTGLHWNGA